MNQWALVMFLMGCQGKDVSTPDTDVAVADTDTDTDTDADTDADTDTDTVVDADTDTVPSPVVLQGQCDGNVDIWLNPNPGLPELHMIGLYESDGGHNGPPGTTTVNVNRATEMILVFSSYEDVDWVINAVPGANITRIFLNGYNPQTVMGVNAPVDNHSPYQNWFGDIGYTWQDAGTQLVATQVQNITGLTMTSFAGCYHGTGFSID